MAKQFFIGKRSSSTDGGYWVSFENHERLETTKSELYERCLPCLWGLYNQLMRGCEEIELGEAFDCWKVVVPLANEDQCMEVLRRFEEKQILDRPTKGKFGKGRRDYKTVALMFHCRSVEEKESLLWELKNCVEGIGDPGKVFASKACSNLYSELFGAWEAWERVCRIKRPEKIPAVIERLKELLLKEKTDERPA